MPAKRTLWEQTAATFLVSAAPAQKPKKSVGGWVEKRQEEETGDGRGQDSSI